MKEECLSILPHQITKGMKGSIMSCTKKTLQNFRCVRNSHQIRLHTLLDLEDIFEEIVGSTQDVFEKKILFFPQSQNDGDGSIPKIWRKKRDFVGRT
jgi:hypothetical protein